MTAQKLLTQPLASLLKEKPYLRDFFTALGVSLPAGRTTLKDFLDSIDAETLERLVLRRDEVTQQCLQFIEQMDLFSRQTCNDLVTEVLVKGGCDKEGNPETIDLLLNPGEITAVVGPTGSGKSRLLGDIECLAQRDTPSGRQVLVNGEVADEKKRLSGEQQLVAQLSQNMNFVMDLTVREFLDMHARSKLMDNIEEKMDQVFSMATELAGEPFGWQSPITSLSGGQSRALMIADVACLSSSPIVLIDEIENAGVDRKKALSLLVEKDKIVLLATHDPLLALSAHRRVIIANGGMIKMVHTDEQERKSLVDLLELDESLTRLREQVRRGERVSFRR